MVWNGLYEMRTASALFIVDIMVKSKGMCTIILEETDIIFEITIRFGPHKSVTLFLDRHRC